MAQGIAWEADILRRLEQRNKNECHKYLEIYGACRFHFVDFVILYVVGLVVPHR